MNEVVMVFAQLRANQASLLPLAFQLLDRVLSRRSTLFQKVIYRCGDGTHLDRPTDSASWTRDGTRCIVAASSSLAPSCGFDGR